MPRGALLVDTARVPLSSTSTPSSRRSIRATSRGAAFDVLPVEPPTRAPAAAAADSHRQSRTRPGTARPPSTRLSAAGGLRPRSARGPAPDGRADAMTSFRSPLLSDANAGKVALVTEAAPGSAGDGALELGGTGAKVAICGRRPSRSRPCRPSSGTTASPFPPTCASRAGRRARRPAARALRTHRRASSTTLAAVSSRRPRRSRSGLARGASRQASDDRVGADCASWPSAR
jgi:hypothetical protein